MIGTEIFIEVSLTRNKPTKLTWQIKLANFARFILRLDGVNMSASLFELTVDELSFEQQAICKICIMDGRAIADELKVGSKFEIPIGDDILATGEVLRIIPNSEFE